MIYCATCKKEINNIEDLSRHNLKHVITIPSAFHIFGMSNLLLKVSLNNTQSQKNSSEATTSQIYEKYILPSRVPSVHLDNNHGLSECGIKSSRHRNIIISKDITKINCYRCKKTYAYKRLR